METIHLSTNEFVIAWALVNGGVGFVLGMVPLGFGYFRGRRRLGAIAIMTTTIGGAILGIVFIIPAMALFTWLVMRGSRELEVTEQPADNPEHD